MGVAAGRVDAILAIDGLGIQQKRKNYPRLPVWPIVPIVLGVRWSFAKTK